MITEQRRIIAETRAGLRHRHLGGVGAPPAELIAAELAALEAADREFDATHDERGLPLYTEQRDSRAMADTLLRAQAEHHNAQAGYTKPKQEYLRSFEDKLTGVKLRSYAHNQPIARPELAGLIDPEDCGAALVTMLTGRPMGKMTPALRAMSEGVNTAGGLLVSEQLASTVIDLARAKSRVLAAGAQTLAMESDTCRIARLTTDPTISAVGENAAIPFSDAAFDSILLTARKYGCIVPCSNELLSDAPNAGQIVMNALTNAIAAKIDSLLLDGDGAFIGVMADPSIGETGSVGGITYDDLLVAQWNVRNLNAEPNAAILNPKTAYALNILRDVPTGSYLQPPPALASIAMLDTTRQADTQMIVGAWEHLIFGIRQSLMIATSDTAGDSFVKDQTFFKAVFRADAAIARPMFHRLMGLTY